MAYLKYGGDEATGVFPMFDAIGKEGLECYQQGWILSQSRIMNDQLGSMLQPLKAYLFYGSRIPFQ